MKTRHFSCSMKNCHKSFRIQEMLDQHELNCQFKTDKSKDFVCKMCSKILTTKQSLREHSLTHKEKKNFRCTEVGCGKKFKQSSQLCNHRKVHRLARIKEKSQLKKVNKNQLNKVINHNEPLLIANGTEFNHSFNQMLPIFIRNITGPYFPNYFQFFGFGGIGDNY